MPDRCSETYLTLFFRPSESDFDMILLLCLWGCGHRVSDVHKSTGFGPSQINGADLLFAEEDMEVAVGLGRTQCHGLNKEKKLKKKKKTLFYYIKKETHTAPRLVAP